MTIAPYAPPSAATAKAPASSGRRPNRSTAHAVVYANTSWSAPRAIVRSDIDWGRPPMEMYMVVQEPVADPVVRPGLVR